MKLQIIPCGVGRYALVDLERFVILGGRYSTEQEAQEALDRTENYLINHPEPLGATGVPTDEEFEAYKREIWRDVQRQEESAWRWKPPKWWWLIENYIWPLIGYIAWCAFIASLIYIAITLVLIFAL